MAYLRKSDRSPNPNHLLHITDKPFTVMFYQYNIFFGGILELVAQVPQVMVDADEWMPLTRFDRLYAPISLIFCASPLS
jgi:hypothetical protein